jgi:upstream activation factor subunit UAF30
VYFAPRLPLRARARALGGHRTRFRLTSEERHPMATKKKKAAKKATKRHAVKKSAAKRPAKKKAASKRKPNAAFMKPMHPTAALAAVVGSSPMPRTEVTKKLWQYIKRKGLQDQKERRMINADDALKVVFGGKARVSMFDMTKLVNKHLKDA